MNLVNLFYTRLIQFQKLKKKILYFPKSPLIIKITKLLVKQGLILGYNFQDNFIIIYLKYINNTGVFTFYPISTLLFKNISYKILLKLKNHCPIIFLSTPYGVLTGTTAIKMKIGGKIIGLFL